MRALVLVILGFLAGPLAAQTLPEAVVQAVRSDPAPFLDLAADLIHGFGEAGGIDRAGVDRFVALQRAEARAAALRRLQVADLDFDGQVTRDEMAILAAAAAAKSRGRLWALRERADGDGNGTVSGDEAQVFGRAATLAGFTTTEEALVRSVLTFDADANGLVSLSEVKAAVAALGV